MAWLQKKGDYWQAGFRDLNKKTYQRSTRIKVKGKDRIESAALKAKAQIVANKFEMAVRGEVGNQAKFRKTLTELTEIAGSAEANRTLESVANTYLDKAKSHYGASSYYAVKSIIEKLVEGLGGELSIDSIIPSQIQRVLDMRMTEVAPSTVSKDRKFLSKFFSDTVSQGLIDTNPVAGTLTIEFESISREPFTDEEIEVILDSADVEWNRAIKIALMTGLRISDSTRILGEYYDKDLDAIKIKESKTKKNLTIPVNETLRDYMALADVTPSLRKRTTQSLSRQFDRILKGCEIDRKPEKVGKNMVYRKSFHSLRHNFISNLANAGIDPEIRQKLAGHSSVEVHEIYTHHNIERMRDAIQKIS